MASNQLAAPCATCGERIVAIERTDGVERRWELCHWAGIGQDHEPAPTALSAHHAPLSCDFCGAAQPTWVFETRFATRIINYSEHDVVAHEISEPWAARVACKRSILERDVDRMLHRRMITERRHGLGDDSFVRDVLRFEEPPPTG